MERTSVYLEIGDDTVYKQLESIDSYILSPRQLTHPNKFVAIEMSANTAETPQMPLEQTNRQPDTISSISPPGSERGGVQQNNAPSQQEEANQAGYAKLYQTLRSVVDLTAPEAEGGDDPF